MISERQAIGELLTIGQAARRLGLSTARVGQLNDALSPERVGRYRAYRPDVIDAFGATLDERRARTRAERLARLDAVRPRAIAANRARGRATAETRAREAAERRARAAAANRERARTAPRDDRGRFARRSKESR